MRSYVTTLKWCGVTGSNRRPSACKADALPAELTPQKEHKAPREQRKEGKKEV